MLRLIVAMVAGLLAAERTWGKGRSDRLGDPLPPRAVARLGTHRLCCQYVGAMALAADASALAAFNAASGELFVWDLPSGKQRWRAALPSLGQFSPRNNRLAFSPDGKKLALNHEEGHLRVWDAATGRPLHTLGQSRLGAPVAFSPDGRKLVTAEAYTAEVWDVQTGKRLVRWPIEGYVAPLAWSPDGRNVVLVDHPYLPEAPQNGERFSRWDPATGKRRLSRWLTKGRRTWVALSRDGKRAALLVKDMKQLSVRDVAGGRELFRASAKVPFGRPVFSGDGRLLACVANDDVLRVWEAATGKLLRSVKLRPGNVESLVLSGDGQTVAFRSGLDDRLRVWDLKKNRQLGKFVGHRSGPLHVGFSADGKEVITTGFDPVLRDAKGYAGWSLRCWDAATGAQRRVVKDPAGRVLAWVVSPAGRHVGLVLSDFTLRLWDARRGRELRHWRLPIYDGLIGPDGKKENTRALAVHAFAFSSDGRELLASGEKVYRWQVATGKELPAFRLPNAQLVTLPACGLTNPTWVPVHVWNSSRLQLVDAKSGRPGPRFPVPARARGVSDQALSADGRTLAVLETGRVRLWEVAGGGLRGVVAGAAKAEGVLAFSPDGRLLAVAAKREGDILLWDLALGKARARLQGHQARLASLAFSPDGKRLASGAYDNVAYVWDVTGDGTGKYLSGEQLEQLWTDLHSPQAARAYRAVWRLAGDPARGVLFLRRRLLTPSDDEPRIARLIAELDDRSYRVRQAASRALARLGARAAPALVRKLKEKPTAEVRQRIAKLLKLLPAGPVPSARLVGTRAVEALEKAGTPAARRFLAELAKRKMWSGEAKAALQRLRSKAPAR
jgi:WD40 repeat protein